MSTGNRDLRCQDWVTAWPSLLVARGAMWRARPGEAHRELAGTARVVDSGAGCRASHADSQDRRGCPLLWLPQARPGADLRGPLQLLWRLEEGVSTVGSCHSSLEHLGVGGGGGWAPPTPEQPRYPHLAHVSSAWKTAMTGSSWVVTTSTLRNLSTSMSSWERRVFSWYMISSRWWRPRK